MPLTLRRTWLPMLVTFVAYAATAKLGVDLPLSQDLVSPVWVPAGIGLAALTLGGLRLWPAVFAGAFLADAWGGAPVPLAAAMAVGNVLESGAGAWLLRRADFSPALDRFRHVGVLIGASMLCSVLAATNGVTVQWVHDELTLADYPDRWMLWWFADFMGMLVVAPLIFAAATQWRERAQVRASRLAEFVFVNVLLAAVSVMVFAGDAWRYPHILLPLFTWATIRFRALGSSTATFLVAGIGVAYTLGGTTVLQGATPTQTVQVLQGLLALVGLSVLVIAAALTERDEALARSEDALRAEQQVARKLREMDAMKDRLLAAVSHELRTPLTSILALSTMLEDRIGTVDRDKQLEMYERLTLEARRLDALLSDLLDLERLRAGIVEPRYERVDVSEVVRGVLDRYAERGRIVSVELEATEIECDAAKVERIVDNLLENAFKHTPPSARVTVSVRAQDDGVLLTVDDEGDGVSAADKRAIFEPFNRGSAALEHAPGTGIGLSLVAHFAELHGGHAWVEDRDGGGASFRVYLPGTHARTN